jgi:uncharacterized protein YegP (UPF0339 family)
MVGLIDIGSRGLLGEQYEFKIRKSKDGQFYWTLHNTRGNVEAVAQSETYKSKQSAYAEIQQIMRLAATAVITDLAK